MPLMPVLVTYSLETHRVQTRVFATTLLLGANTVEPSFFIISIK